MLTDWAIGRTASKLFGPLATILLFQCPSPVPPPPEPAVAPQTGSHSSTGAPSKDYTNARRYMTVFATQVRMLDDALNSSADQEQVLALLDEMLTSLLSLQEQPEHQQHPLLREQLPRLLEELDDAKTHAAATPPKFTAAATFVGVCAGCHTMGLCPFGNDSSCHDLRSSP